MMDFAAARQRIEALAEIELDPIPMQATLLERVQCSLNHDEFYELIHITMEESK